MHVYITLKREIFFCTIRVGRHIGHSEIERRKKIAKESENSEMIDGERKN